MFHTLCGFEFRIVPLYRPHVVRGHLKEARSNLVVTFAAIKLQGPRFKPWLGQNFVVILDGELRMKEDTIYKVGH